MFVDTLFGVLRKSMSRSVAKEAVASGQDDVKTYRRLGGKDTARFRSRIEFWSKASRKAFPWHYCGDPYRVFVAEVLVRKTRAADAVGVYESLVGRYPTAESLASADIRQLRALIRPVGLPNRADVLREGCRWVVREFGGVFPSDPGALMRWKGVGRYTANAIACLAFDRSYPMVDEAVGRLVRRWLGVDATRTASSDSELWSWVAGMIPSRECREFNLALLHVSSEVCKPARPSCGRCPLRSECVFAAAKQDGGRSSKSAA